MIAIKFYYSNGDFDIWRLNMPCTGGHTTRVADRVRTFLVNINHYPNTTAYKKVLGMKAIVVQAWKEGWRGVLTYTFNIDINYPVVINFEDKVDNEHIRFWM